MQQETKNNPVSILNYAMNYGVILGLLWAFKYLVFVGQDLWSPLIYLYYLLNAGTFLLVYIFYFKYRDSEPEKQKTKYKCIAFVVSLCFFASLFECGTMFLHYQFLDPSYFVTKVEPALRAIAEAFPYPENTKTMAIDVMTNKIYYIFSTFVSNLIVGAILGALFALIIGNRKMN